MPVFFELATDAFEDNFNKNLDATSSRRRAGIDRARRPFRGLEVKTDTYASIRLIKSNGEEIKLIDSGSTGGESSQNSNFILQSVTEARMEKHQIVDTFGEPYLYLFGEAPRFLDVSAILVDSFDFNWYAEWWENYNRYLRGTRSVELNARTYLFYDDNIVEGYMLQAQSQKTSETPLMASLSFRLFLTNYQNISLIGVDGSFPLRPGVQLPNIQLRQLPSGSLDKRTLSQKLRATQADTAAAGSQLGILSNIANAAGIDPLANVLQKAQGAVGGFSDFTGLLANTAGSVQNAIDGISGLFGGSGAQAPANAFRSVPLRGKISDNDDEYTAPYPFSPAPVVEGKKGGHSLADIENVALKTITAARDVGAAVSNVPNFLKSVGLSGGAPKSPFAMTSSAGQYRQQ